MGDVMVSRYYEYCTGSIIGCVIREREAAENDCKYLQGYDFEWDMEDGGFWVVGKDSSGSVVDEIKIAGFPSDRYESNCRDCNKWAHIRGHGLPMFEGLVYIGNSCCNTGTLVQGCHEDAELPCRIRLETYYESGDPAAQLRKLEREKKVVEESAVVQGQLEQQALDIVAEKEQRRQELETAIANDNNALTTATSERDAIEDEINILEDKVVSGGEEVNDQVDLVQETKDELDPLNEEKLDEIEIRDEAFAEVLTQEQLEKTQTDAAKGFNKEAVEKGVEKSGLEADLANETPGSLAYDTILAQIELLEVQIESLEIAAANATSTAEDAKEEAEAQQEIADEAQSNIDSLDPQISSLTATLSQKSSDLITLRNELTTNSQDLLGKKDELAEKELLVEALTTHTNVTLVNELETVNETIAAQIDLAGQYEVAKNEYLNELDRLNDEIDRLEDEVEMLDGHLEEASKPTQAKTYEEILKEAEANAKEKPKGDVVWHPDNG